MIVLILAAVAAVALDRIAGEIEYSRARRRDARIRNININI